MNSTPHFHSQDCKFTSDDAYDFLTPTVAGQMWGGGCNEECFPMFENNGSVEGFILPESDITSSLSSSSSFSLPKSFTPAYPDQLLGASDVPIFPSLLPDWSDNFSGLSGSNNFPMIHTFAGGLFDEHCNFSQECNTEFLSEYSPFGLDSSNWEMKRNLTPLIEESDNVKVGRYSAEERKDRIVRYLKKRNERNFNKTIKYACRKTLADRRVRVRGRFARNNESCEGTIITKQMKNQPEGDAMYYSDYANQIKEDDDGLQLQEAIDSLMYLPYISG